MTTSIFYNRERVFLNMIFSYLAQLPLNQGQTMNADFAATAGISVQNRRHPYMSRGAGCGTWRRTCNSARHQSVWEVWRQGRGQDRHSKTLSRGLLFGSIQEFLKFALAKHTHGHAWYDLVKHCAQGSKVGSLS